ncbi:deoxyuridine 5'-triphosphate nucleotidohydrolase-like [Vigna radiata var. radiata]|uniref:Deoxyuridine 5'-triphosphate nucleotidohydrolase n=1 Tax=Vigna radiata var. radiata TaxID=3916 RepID=A0A1S3UH11_VIGRR|nr:deoxyuridine 5'-triphosphate nucleotidohydrolase-like [Vigna radiata var. radiata]
MIFLLLCIKPTFHPSFPLQFYPLAVMAPSQPESHATNGSCQPSPNDVSSTPPFLRVKKLSDKAVLPSRASPLSAGYDLSSAVETKVPARGKALVATDISIAIPEGTYARVAPRSGLAWKHSIDVGAGVIDADYRGPVGVILFNHSDLDFEVKVGDRVAQLIIEKIVTPSVTEVDDLDETVRGEGGFGSTGV